MRAFFEFLLILAVLVLAGGCYFQHQKLQNLAPAESSQEVQIGDEEVLQIRKLAVRFGIDAEKANNDSIAELLADIEVLVYNGKIVPEALTDEDFNTVKTLIGTTEKETIEKLEKQNTFLKEAQNKKAVLVP